MNIIEIMFKWYTMNDEEKKNYMRSLTFKERKKLLYAINILKTDKNWADIIKQYKKIMNSKNIMILDVETTGFSYSSRIVQFSYSICDEDGTQHEIYDSVVKQEKDIVIPPETIKIHGITDEIAATQGQKLSKIVNIFENKLKTITKIIGHNINFDINIMKNELTRINKLECLDHLNKIKTYCTMKNTKYALKLLNTKGTIKNPKLSELYNYLFNTNITNEHNSKYDVLNTSKCYFEFIKREKEIINMVNCMNDIM